MCELMFLIFLMFEASVRESVNSKLDNGMEGKGAEMMDKLTD